MEEANKLGVGADGFRWQSFTDRGARLPPQSAPCELFRIVAYDCWHFAALGVRLDATTGAITGGCTAIRRAV